MKTILKLMTLGFLGVIGTAHAANTAACPEGFRASYECVSTPTAGDSSIVSKMFEAISVCKTGKVISLALKAEGQTEMAEVGKVTARAGGVTYTVLDGIDGKEKALEFSVGTGGNPNVSSQATLVMFLDGKPMSSRYSCDRAR